MDFTMTSVLKPNSADVSHAPELLRPVVSWAAATLRHLASFVRPLGWCVIGLAVIGWVVGVMFGWTELLTLAATSVILLAFSGCFLFGRSAYDIRIELRPQRTVVGMPANGQITLKNSSGKRLLPSRADLVIGQSLASFSTPSLGPGQEHKDLFRISTDRRSVIRVGPGRVVRADPIGLFARVVSNAEATLLYVHPRTIKVEGTGAGFLRDLEGQESTEISPSDLAFHSIREYRPGDDSRHVHWRTSARTGQLMVQQFVDTRRSRVLLILNEDLNSFANDDAFETAVSAVGSIAQQVIRDGQSRTVVSGRRILRSESPSALLDELSGVSAYRDVQGLSNSVRIGREQSPGASLVVIVTGGVTPLDEVNAAARRFSTAARVVVLMVGEDQSGLRKRENVLLFSLSSLSELRQVMNVVAMA